MRCGNASAIRVRMRPFEAQAGQNNNASCPVLVPRLSEIDLPTKYVKKEVFATVERDERDCDPLARCRKDVTVFINPMLLGREECIGITPG